VLLLISDGRVRLVLCDYNLFTVLTATFKFRRIHHFVAYVVVINPTML